MARTRGRKPTPTHLKLVTGATRKDRMNQSEAALPQLGLPEAPDHLSDEAKIEWSRISRDLYDAGLLTKIDRAILAAYCQAYGRWVIAEGHLKAMAKNAPADGLIVRTKGGNLIQNPLVGTANKAMADMARYATDLGMTPSARSRVTARPPETEDEDPADKYFA